MGKKAIHNVVLQALWKVSLQFTINRNVRRCMSPPKKQVGDNPCTQCYHLLC